MLLPAEDDPGERRAALTGRIEEGYSPARHMALIAAVTVGAAALAAGGLRRPSPAEWALVPLTIVASNFGEWALHRWVLHEPTRLRVAYERHARIHHVIYTHEAFEIRSARELRFVLMPWHALVGMLLGIAPIALALTLAWSGNAARVFVLVGVFYYAVYEVLHSLYHLPATAPVARTRVVQALRRLHRRHHDPSVMRRCNFNVTFPIADWVLRTWVRD